MMHYKILFTFLLISTLSYGQVDNYIKIVGTKYKLIPPKGFVATTKFSGFENVETGASIMVNEVPGPYKTITDEFTAEALQSKGMTLISKKTVDFNNSKATLVKVSQSVKGVTYLKQILLFGNNSSTVVVNGTYPEVHNTLEEEIINSLLSTKYDKKQIDNPLEAVPFTIDVRGTEYKFAKYMSGSLLFSTDGKIPTNKPILIVGNSFSKVSALNQKQYAQDRLKQLPGGELSSVKEIK
jgi:hypothetical protein